MNRLLVLLPEVSITNSRRVVDARNKLTHGYDEIENVQVWSILINHLPILKAEVKSLLDEQLNSGRSNRLILFRHLKALRTRLLHVVLVIKRYIATFLQAPVWLW
jgi:hypothetical protein